MPLNFCSAMQCLFNLVAVLYIVTESIAVAPPRTIPSFPFGAVPIAEFGEALRLHGAITITKVPGLEDANFRLTRVARLHPGHENS